ncbi:sugar kinase, ribokinase [Corynebacterium mustelae]|uniref:Sugar kinase, ribokinase n=1 Tax=Corynebacterium mustelae TaxID=571915 RepID=A0A0G3H2I3_9CORY|nr:carbohydrate kinase [Corynebacterium mustelae]AKK06965.1 sugar kinase, ribokinase [Corynebacterium mustelae]
MITVCGEGLVDLVPMSEGAGSTDCRLSPLSPALGGGPFNVAIAAARQDAPTQLLSRLSRDNFGATLVDALQAEGVGTSLIQRGDEPTTLAVTSRNLDGSAEYTFYLEGTADRFVDPPAEIATDIACFGTVSLALEPGASRLASLLHTLSANGTFIALDPNIRPFYATDAHRDFIYSLLHDVDLLKLSDEEDEFLHSPSAPIKMITRGGAGIEVIVGGETVMASTPAITVADTIGAGDTVMGCVIAEIHRLCGGKNVREQAARFTLAQWHDIAAYAAKAAAINCTRYGANPPRRNELI